MDYMTITLTLPRALSLARLCKALRAIGLVMSYDGNGCYTLSEADE